MTKRIQSLGDGLLAWDKPGNVIMLENTPKKKQEKKERRDKGRKEGKKERMILGIYTLLSFLVYCEHLTGYR